MDIFRAARLARYGEVSSSLMLFSDHKLGWLVDDAGSTGSGIGGASAVVDVAGVPVFVKRVPLTDLERRPGSVMSTANLFGLPVFCQYGAGGPGFGAWRELAANAVTTGWVLAGRTEAFPLMYHWRVLPGAVALAEELADVEGAVAYWGWSQPDPSSAGNAAGAVPQTRQDGPGQRHGTAGSRRRFRGDLRRAVPGKSATSSERR